LCTVRYEQSVFGYSAVSVLSSVDRWLMGRRRNGGLQNCVSNFFLNSGLACCLLPTGFLLGLIFNPEHRTNMLLRNVCWLSPGYMAKCSGRYNCLLIELCAVYVTTLSVAQTCAQNIRMRVSRELQRKWNLASTSRPN
jgi:hypothetical protein